MWRDLSNNQPRRLSSGHLHRGAGFAVRFPLLDGFPLVVRLLALRQADGDLHFAALEVEPQRHEREPTFDGLANQLADLLPVQEQLPLPGGLVVGIPAVTVRADVHVVDEHLAVFEACEAVAQVHAAFADRLYLGALEHDTRLECFEDVVVVQRLPVLGHHAFGLLALGLGRRHVASVPERLARTQASAGGPARRCRARSAASSTACTMLPASATPRPAMSKAVP